jgi:acyl CoA:acetate/3-ketoacid CoA transferase alpha subunit
VAITHEIIRKRKRNLEIAGSAAWHANSLLIGAGCVNRMLVCADTVEFGGVTPTLKRAVERGKLIVEDYSFYALGCRLMAAAIGVPFFPTKSMLGSDMLRHNWLEENKKFHLMECPFSKEKVVLVPALSPDVAVIHAQYADEEGNVQVFGPTDLIDEQARASKKVLVTVEKIVTNQTIRKRPELTIIPSFLVDAIVEVPYGAYPTGLFGFYNYDIDHLKYAYEQSRSEEAFKKYLDEFIFRVDNYAQVIRRIGSKRIGELRAEAARNSY